MTIYALGELEALCKKACYGAGFAWGEAEEAAKAVAMLCTYELPAVEALVQVLPLQKSRLRPVIEGRQIVGSQLLCPIMTSLALADRACDIDAEIWQISALQSPLLTLPILWRAGEFHNKIFHMQSDNWDAYAGKNAFVFSGDASVAELESVEISVVKTAPASLAVKRFDSVTVEGDVEKLLLQFFMQTTVPESDESRLQGAGAGLSDND